MKRLLPLLLLSAAGCQAGPRPEDAVTRADLLAAEARFSTKNEKNFVFYQEATNTIGQLERRVAQLESMIKSYDFEIRRLNEKLAGVRPGGVPVVTNPETRIEDAIKETDAQLARLKDGGRIDDIVLSLQPIARHAAPRACEALKGAVRDVQYMQRLEHLLSKLPAEALKMPLEDALKSGVARYAAARVVGEVGDKELSKLLEPHTADADFDFCFVVGSSLVRCKNRAGVPALLRVLRAQDKNTRFLAINSLRSLAKEDFGYDYQKAPDVNAVAIKSWEDWYEKAGAKLFE